MKPSDLVLRYFAALDAGDPNRAVESFAFDATYVRPAKTPSPTPGGPMVRQLQVSRGRDEILRFAKAQDGISRAAGRTSRHVIGSVLDDGDECFVELTVPGPPGGPDVVCLVHATTGGPDHLIRRYVAVALEGPTGGIPAAPSSQ